MSDYASLTRTMSEGDLRHLVPSAFMERPFEKCTPRYTHISTSRLIGEMAIAGFQPVSATETRCRGANRQPFAKHMIRFARGLEARDRVGDTIPQVGLVNSHDGSSAYYLFSGGFRIHCLNGLVMVIPGETCELRIPHIGDIITRVIEGSHIVMESAKRSLEVAQEWQAIPMTGYRAGDFAEKALKLRWPERAPITAIDALVSRHSEDNVVNLWTVFNRVQENLIRGGQAGRTATNRRTTTRAVRAIDTDLSLNRRLWQLGNETAAELKAA